MVLSYFAFKYINVPVSHSDKEMTMGFKHMGEIRKKTILYY